MTPRLVAVTPAKLNLGLEIVGRRADGYHELVTILQAISVFDVFEWTHTGRAFQYSGPAGVAPDVDLALRALQSAPDVAQWTGRLTLRKQIPLAAGLGGGSSDAALALRIALPDRSDDELRRRAALLGADVPFFIGGGTALATGIGTYVKQLASTPRWFVVVAPPLELHGKTRLLYAGLVRDDFSSGGAVRAIAADSNDGATLREYLPNAFERQLYTQPVVRYARAQLLRAGAPRVAMSGAGPSLFSMCASYADAARLAELLPQDVGVVRVACALAELDSRPARRIAQALRGRMDPC